MTRLRSRTGSLRLLLGIVDAGMSSVGNFGASVLAAHAMTLRGFGLFTTAMLIALIITGLSRAAHGDALILTRQGDPARADLQMRTSIPSVITTGAVGGGLLALGAVTAMAFSSEGGHETAYAILATAAVLPLMLLQDHYRWIEYARGRVILALANTTIWTVASVGALAVVAVQGTYSPFVGMLVWGGTTLPAIVFAILCSGFAPIPSRRPSWLAEHRRLVGQLVQDFVLLQAIALGAIVLMAALAGATEIAQLRKAQILLAPLSVAITGLLGALQPLLVERFRKAGLPGVQITTAWVSCAAALGCVAYGVVVAHLPENLAGKIVGSDWQDAQAYVLPWTVQLSAGLIGGCAGVALRASGRVAVQVRIRWFLAPASLLAVTIGTLTGGALRGLWLLAASAVATGVIWVALLAADRVSPRWRPAGEGV